MTDQEKIESLKSKPWTALLLENPPLPASGKRYEFTAPDVQGLLLRIAHSGVRTFIFQYDMKGKRNRMFLGRFPGLKLADARRRAGEFRGAIERGENPLKQKKEAERVTATTGFKACAADFVAKHSKVHNKPKTAKQVERFLERFATPKFGDTPVKDLTRRDMIELVEDVAANISKREADQLSRHLSKMFNWLIDRDIVAANPARRLKIPGLDLKGRERVLSDTELVALWTATGKLGDVAGPLVRFLALTGVREGEAANLRWDEIDGDWALMPASRMKANRNFKAPMSKWAKAIVDSMPKIGALVFTTTGDKPFSGWSKIKVRLDALMEAELPKGKTLESWRFHDLRRTMATGVAMLGYRREVIDRLLAHVPQKGDVTSSVYNRFMYDAEVMEAAQKWAAHIGRLTSGLEVVHVSA